MKINEAVQTLGGNVSEAERLLPFRIGDIVLAGAGMRAELRSSYFPGQTDALVRWVDDQNKGSHHSRVPWSTVRSI